MRWRRDAAWAPEPAGVYATEAPDRFDRLVLDAFTYTGEGAPEIMRRREQAELYRSRPYRP